MHTQRDRLLRVAGLFFQFLLLGACAQTGAPPDPQLAAQWMRTSLAFARSERLGPPIAARISAYGSLALYEGYASDRRSPLRSLAGQLNGLTSTIQTLRSSCEQGLSDTVTNANNLLQNIANINSQVAASPVQGSTSASLLPGRAERTK